MQLPQLLDSKVVIYAQISPKMVNPRDKAWERRRRRHSILFYSRLQEVALHKSHVIVILNVPDKEVNVLFNDQVVA